MTGTGSPHDFAYVHSDIPEGMTIRAWRTQRAADDVARRTAARAARRRWGVSCMEAVAGVTVRVAPAPATAQPRGRGMSRLLGAVVLAAIVVATLIEGHPRQLPGVALGSAVLLDAERALALLVASVATLSIGVQAARGRLPIELSTSGLRYEAEAAADAAAAVAKLQEQFDDLVAIVDELADRLDGLLGRP